MGTPIPGHVPGLAAQGTPGVDSAAGGKADGALPPRLAAITRKVDSAVGEGVACALLKIALQESTLDESGKAKGEKAQSDAVKAEAAAAAASAGAAKAIATASGEQVPPAEKAQWQSKLQALQAGAATGAAYAEAMARAPAWVSAIVASVSVVIDQNTPPLTAALHTILKDGIAAAVRSLQARATTGGAAADEAAAKAKAEGVMNTLSAAVDNVRGQFVVGLRSSVPQATAAQLGKPLLDTMCELAVTERCVRLRQLATQADITARIWEEVAIVQDFISNVSKTGPQPWLQQLLNQSAIVQLPEPLAAYIESHIAVHLDPYIDGEITSPEEERGTSPMFKLLCEAYERDHGRELPAPPEVVLALYVRHTRPNLPSPHLPSPPLPSPHLPSLPPCRCATESASPTRTSASPIWSWARGGCPSPATRRMSTVRPSARRWRRPSSAISAWLTQRSRACRSRRSWSRIWPRSIRISSSLTIRRMLSGWPRPTG